MTTPTTKTFLVRSARAGVFYGQIESREGDVVTMTNARRVWFWDGAATLSELANEGPSKPKSSKMPAPTTGQHIVLGVDEIIEVTDRALAKLNAVPVWSEN